MSGQNSESKGEERVKPGKLKRWGTGIGHATKVVTKLGELLRAIAGAVNQLVKILKDWNLM